MRTRNAENFSNANALIVAASVIAIIWSTGMAESALMSLQHVTRTGTVEAVAARTNVRSTLVTALSDELRRPAPHLSAPVN